jgi:hypothetical protein
MTGSMNCKKERMGWGKILLQVVAGLKENRYGQDNILVILPINIPLW